MIMLSLHFMMAAVFFTLTERTAGEIFDKDCSNVRPFDIYPLFDNFSCYIIEDRVDPTQADPTSSFDRLVIAKERRRIKAASSEQFLDSVSKLDWEEDSVALYTVFIRDSPEFYRRNFQAIHRIHGSTYTCPGSFIRIHPNHEGSLCTTISVEEGFPELSDRFWLDSTYCNTGSRAWLSRDAVKYETYAVYPEVYQCPTLEIIFPENGVISALPGENVILQLELADEDEVSNYIITCEDEQVPNATISENGLVSWNVSSGLDPNFQARAECEIVTGEGIRRSANVTFEIFQCDCSGHGTCRLATNATRGLGNYVCECDNGYEGSLCEIDIDECASNPCFPNVLCVNFNAMYWCMDCPPGMEGDGIDCTELPSTTKSVVSASPTLPTNPSPMEDLDTTTESIDFSTDSNATKPSRDSSSPAPITSTTNTPAVTDNATKTLCHSKTVMWAMLLFAVSIEHIAVGC